MNDDELALFTSSADAERRSRLAEQLCLLTVVRDDVQSRLQHLRTSVTGTPGYQWRSTAETGYAERVAELGGALDRASRELEAACEAVQESLVQLGRVE